jgi:hypothetical protein
LRDDNQRIEGWLQGTTLDLQSCNNLGGMPLYQQGEIISAQACIASVEANYSVRRTPIDGDQIATTQEDDYWVKGRFLDYSQNPIVEWYYLFVSTDKQGWVFGDSLIFFKQRKEECENLPTIFDKNDPLEEWSELPEFIFPTPLARSVDPLAIAFHEKAQQFGLPMPFEIWPVTEPDAFQNGYGPNGFAYENCSNPPIPTAIPQPNQPTPIPVFDNCQYRSTNSIHPGLDFYTTPRESNVVSVCDGIMVSGRTPGGGSVSLNAGQGFSLRCFANDPMDTDGDGLRNLSNIVVVYNHILRTTNFAQRPNDYGPYPIVQKGDILGASIAYGANGSVVAHLDLQVYIARGMVKNGAIQLNPRLIFALPLPYVYNENPELPYPSDYNQWSLLGRVENNEIFFWSNPTTEPPFLYSLNTYLQQFYSENTLFDGPDCINISVTDDLSSVAQCLVAPREDDIYTLNNP